MSRQQQDRMWLAQVMGWTRISMKYVAMDERSYPFGCPPSTEYADGLVNPKYREQIPNPFTSANDDYAVLEWARKTDFCIGGHPIWELIDSELIRSGNEFISDYKVGNIARATLTVLGGQER